MRKNNRPATVDVVYIVFLHECRRFQNVCHWTIQNTYARHPGTVRNADTTHVIISDGRDLTSTPSAVVVLSLRPVRHWVTVTGVQVKTPGSIVVGLQVNVRPFQT